MIRFFLPKAVGFRYIKNRGYFPVAAPLSNAVVYILLALAKGDLHGYGIMKEVKGLSNGDFRIGPGTLYDNLKTLMLEGMVTEIPAVQTEAESSRRRYHLTSSGAALLTSELQRLNLVLKTGKRRLASVEAREAS
jgi:DNA-binding PadR family transcriptional regulator